MYVLMILDGWGLSSRKEGNAIFHADTQNMDSWIREYPFTRLRACCEAVGLPPNQMGNSEVGHLNIGAGRVVYSPLMRLNSAVENGEFRNNSVLLQAMSNAKEKERPIHLLGMVSDGGVHSHIDHLLALVDMAERIDVRVAVHTILDGRDTLPRKAERYLVALENRLKECGCGRIADISGRYYSMDRDRRWHRTGLAYDALVKGEGEIAVSAVEGLRNAYERGEGDEFVLPTVICPDGENPVAEDLIKDGDEVIFFNFRPDRARQISHALADKVFDRFERKDILVNLTTMMNYGNTLKVKVAFLPETLRNVLGEVLSDNGIRQLRITESEKFPHVTFFLNGGKEEPFPGEDRIAVPSPKVATYDLQPAMSAPGIVERLLHVLDNYDVVVMNFANPDMVGHTGILEAAVKAVETVDECAGKVVEAVLKRGGTVLVTADHGNAEKTMENDGTPNTAHTLNPVPFIWIGEEAKGFRGELREGAITDIAPTLLKLMGLKVPSEMTAPSIIPEGYFEKKALKQPS
ncbi:MAG: 2,3-bisphosphoglycerate-independent phosphoglycerate mutase [Thermoplasmata archaeon]|nr:2,3-bisphosphoglycerate-independent phosphoglycerate mutase [Thermoplasmata archaeon]